jgi:hypothetical protein
MKYGYRITINLIPNESDVDPFKDMAVCCIENKNDFDTMTEADQTMEHLALKLNIEHPFYIKLKEVLVKNEYKDSFIKIKTDGLEPELEKFMIDLMEKMVKKYG